MLHFVSFGSNCNVIIFAAAIVEALFLCPWTRPQDQSALNPSHHIDQMTSEIPLVDIDPFLAPQDSGETVASLAAFASREQTVKDLYAAFSTWGFCLLKGHGITSELRSALYQTAGDFFTLPLEKKLELHVKNGGVAWRGYMPRGGEATHGHMDHKEGIYFGPEHPDDHPHAGLPLVSPSRPLYGTPSLNSVTAWQEPVPR